MVDLESQGEQACFCFFPFEAISSCVRGFYSNPAPSWETSLWATYVCLVPLVAAEVVWSSSETGGAVSCHGELSAGWQSCGITVVLVRRMINVFSSFLSQLASWCEGCYCHEEELLEGFSWQNVIRHFHCVTTKADARPNWQISPWNLKWIPKIIIHFTRVTFSKPIYPPPSNSHHQDYYIFSRESRPKPSFATVTGLGGRSKVSIR